MPVLGKELTEQAQRKRTYVVRFLYALLLFGAGGMLFKMMLLDFADRPHLLLGEGRWMFEFLFWVQVGGIALLLPAMLCGVVTSEKEHATLTLLMLTRLTPWEVLLQKLGSKLIVIGTYVLLNLPLLAVAYSFGGVSGEQLGLAIYTLVVVALQVGAFALLCSCFFRTTTVAFIASYVGLGIIYAAPPIVLAIVDEFKGVYIDEGWYLWPFPFSAYAWHVTLGDEFPPFAAWLMDELRNFYLVEWVLSFAKGLSPTLMYVIGVALLSLPAWLSTALFLFLARFFLVRRAFLRPFNPILALFRRLDRFFQFANRITGGVEVIRSRPSLPDEKPVAWLEKTRRAVARPHYLIRILVVTMVPTVFFCIFVLALSKSGPVHEAFAVASILIWPPLLLFLTILGAGTFSMERASQTLDVLVTTPLPTRQILREKVSALWRVALVLTLPLLVVLACDAWVRVDGMRWLPEYAVHWAYNNQTRNVVNAGTRISDLGALVYLIFTPLTLLTYLPLAVWVSVWVGMRVRSRTRAAMLAIFWLAMIVAFPFLIAAPIILAIEINGGNVDTSTHWAMDIMMASPVLAVPTLEVGQLPFNATPLVELGGPWLILALHFLFLGSLAWLVRAWCYRRADQLLGRVAPVSRV